MTNEHVCHVCGADGMTRDSVPTEFEYKGHKLVADVHFHFCNACGAELGLGVDQRDTVRSQNRARKAHDGLLLGEEIKAIRTALKLTQEKAQALFGGGPVAFSKYENDDVLHAKMLDVTLRMMRKNEAYLDDYAKEAGVDLPHRKAALFGKSVAKRYDTRSMQVVSLAERVAWFSALWEAEAQAGFADEWESSERAPRSLVVAQYAAHRGC